MTEKFLSNEDRELFYDTMKDVKPLSSRKKFIARSSPEIHIKREKTRQDQSVPDIFLSDHISEPVQTNSILSYCSSNLPSRRFHQLKKGQIPWQARLDLHGLYSDRACILLCSFIQQQIQLKNRCLLIIHGKGGHKGEIPILKNCVNQWLRQIPQVLAFHSALPKDGGSGAIYILLKKEKN